MYVRVYTRAYVDVVNLMWPFHGHHEPNVVNINLAWAYVDIMSLLSIW